MVKHAQTIHQQQLTNCLSMFDHFVFFFYEYDIHNKKMKNIKENKLQITYKITLMIIYIYIYIYIFNNRTGLEYDR